jgi:hypothetical protein
MSERSCPWIEAVRETPIRMRADLICILAVERLERKEYELKFEVEVGVGFRDGAGDVLCSRDGDGPFLYAGDEGLGGFVSL